MAERFQFRGKIYSTAALDEPSLRDLMHLKTDLAEVGINATWSQIERAAVEIQDMTEDEAEQHPLGLVLYAATIWAARRAEGEVVRLSEVLDLRPSEVVWLPSTEDKSGPKAPKKKAAKKASVQPAAPALKAEAPQI
ncbi:MAG TPA: hypothetical protein VJ782_09265 [Aeromicrobium sp.]|nr:hypothetical protein [Aeromicrobium sp.]